MTAVEQVVLVLWFYNLQVGRKLARVEVEIRAVLATGPAVLMLCEAVGYALPDVAGYRVVRDRSTRSRANIAAYVRDDIPVTRELWHDLRETWSRTQHPGTHEPRSWLELVLGRLQLLVGHQPPKGTDNTSAAQQEGEELVVRRMAPWQRPGWRARNARSRAVAAERPRAAFMDGNNRGASGAGPVSMARRISGRVLGRPSIDVAVVRGVDEASAKHVRRVPVAGGRLRVRRWVTFRSDHRKALRVEFSVEPRWLTTTPKGSVQ